MNLPNIWNEYFSLGFACFKLTFPYENNKEADRADVWWEMREWNEFSENVIIMTLTQFTLREPLKFFFS